MSPFKRITVAVAAVLALATFASCSSGDDAAKAVRQPSRNATPVPAPKGTNDAVVAVSDGHPQVPAASAQAAVDGFIAAEIAGDFEASWALLSTDDRTDIGSLETWIQQQSVLPRVIDSSTVSKGPGPIVTEATFDPRIDETVGVIAGGARITWATVEENGGVTIDRATTRADNHYPTDTLAAADATAWLERLRSGQPAQGYQGTLIGSPALTADLAEERGTFRTTDTVELDDWTTPGLVTNAFGPAASTWARVVRFEGPITFDAVMAPFGDRWVVVGVVPV